MSRLEKLSAKIQFLEQERDDREGEIAIYGSGTVAECFPEMTDAEMDAQEEELLDEVERLEAALLATMAKWSRLVWAELRRG